MSDLVDAVAASLADPARVTDLAQDTYLELPGGRMPVWDPVALSDGLPGVTLLFAELAAADGSLRAVAHAHLGAALNAPAPPAGQGLYRGPAALAFATHCAATFGGYGTLLDQLDAAVARSATARAQSDRERIAAGEAIGWWGGYDVITGAAGLGRYLLARLSRTGRLSRSASADVHAALVAVLETLVAIADAGRPAWWARHGGSATGAGGIDLGLAHGVAGPLALLALAQRAGVAVAGQHEAAAQIVDVLEEHRILDAAGPFWPSSDGGERTRFRDVWCYGAAGVGRALHLAGDTFGEPHWTELARSALAGALSTAGSASITDFSLCHGWAGLLQICTRMAHDTGEPPYAESASTIADRIAAAFSPEAPFGYRYTYPQHPLPLDRPGFLEGAAGIALALHSHNTGRPPTTGWDAALLLA
ncbi:lanthionine synthetase C family protein [Pseudonocardia sp. TRM90224]|uniref:lanthionine synthetase C family protein n=1 Tax=Pseudonocardia sp. TRM90224 TaxID=2812678 RepID=UPI001E3043D9|nr:lanthionine synthetase C family protein [Pseudonocardia sp. TRM90224]